MSARPAAPRHLVDVWNPSYAADAMTAHLTVLLELLEEIEDLETEAARLDQRCYEASDRKYQGARAMAARDLKGEYARRVSRRRPRDG